MILRAQYGVIVLKVPLNFNQ